MTLKEKWLYHQIHPFKFAVDIIATAVGSVPLWHHRLLPAILISIPPGFVASVLLVAFANLEPYKESKFGRYVGKTMTKGAEIQRILGSCVVAAGIWNHAWIEFAWGLGIILVAWMQGVYPLSDIA